MSSAVHVWIAAGNRRPSWSCFIRYNLIGLGTDWARSIAFPQKEMFCCFPVLFTAKFDVLQHIYSICRNFRKNSANCFVESKISHWECTVMQLHWNLSGVLWFIFALMSVEYMNRPHSLSWILKAHTWRSIEFGLHASIHELVCDPHRAGRPVRPRTKSRLGWLFLGVLRKKISTTIRKQFCLFTRLHLGSGSCFWDNAQRWQCFLKRTCNYMLTRCTDEFVTQMRGQAHSQWWPSSCGWADRTWNWILQSILVDEMSSFDVDRTRGKSKVTLSQFTSHGVLQTSTDDVQIAHKCLSKVISLGCWWYMLMKALSICYKYLSATTQVKERIWKQMYWTLQKWRTDSDDKADNVNKKHWGLWRVVTEKNSVTEIWFKIWFSFSTFGNIS